MVCILLPGQVRLSDVLSLTVPKFEYLLLGGSSTWRVSTLEFASFSTGHNPKLANHQERVPNLSAYSSFSPLADEGVNYVFKVVLVFVQ